MTVRNPLVLIGGQVQELPTADLLNYAPLDGNGKVLVANLPASGTNILDAYYDYVKLMLHGAAVTDSSPTLKTLTPIGSIASSTTQSKFGGSALYFDGTTAYATTPAHTDFVFGSTDFTVETFVYPTNASAGTNLFGTMYQNIVGQNVLGNSTDAAFNMTLANMVPGASLFNGSTNYGICTAASALSINNWHHLAYTRQGSNLALFVNGVSVATATSALPVTASTRVMPIGADSSGACKFQGYLDDLRITKGVARYTAGFTPPTAQFPDAYSEQTGGLPDVSYASRGRQYANARAFALL